MKIHLKREVYDGREVVKDQDIELGGVTLITGLSGSGKTTVLNQLSKWMDCGYVGQDPDNQIVCDKVWHELAFGLENVGVTPDVMRVRVAEVATVMGITPWFNKCVSELSGGQKQKLCLASVLCTNPEVILLDEPTSMLDPISAKAFLSTVRDLHEDYGIRFVIVEHNTKYIDFADIRYDLVDGYLEPTSPEYGLQLVEDKPRKEIATFNDVTFSYDPPLILYIPKLTLCEGINFVVGPNGVGKTTLLKWLSKRLDSVLMPQDVKMMFSQDTVKYQIYKVPDSLRHLSDVHPFDLSGGEQHLLGLYMTLQQSADWYLLDEPTKGMDKEMSRKIMNIIEQSGQNCVIVSHNLELAARYANNVIFLYNKDVAASGTPRQVFENNLFYKPEGVEWK